MTDDLKRRLAGADEERCGAPMHDDAHDLNVRDRTCDAKPHGADQAHIGADADGNVTIQWMDTPSESQPDGTDHGESR